MRFDLEGNRKPSRNRIVGLCLLMQNRFESWSCVLFDMNILAIFESRLLIIILYVGNILFCIFTSEMYCLICSIRYYINELLVNLVPKFQSSSVGQFPFHQSSVTAVQQHVSWTARHRGSPNALDPGTLWFPVSKPKHRFTL